MEKKNTTPKLNYCITYYTFSVNLLGDVRGRSELWGKLDLEQPNILVMSEKMEGDADFIVGVWLLRGNLLDSLIKKAAVLYEGTLLKVLSFFRGRE